MDEKQVQTKDLESLKSKIRRMHTNWLQNAGRVHLKSAAPLCVLFVCWDSWEVWGLPTNEKEWGETPLLWNSARPVTKASFLLLRGHERVCAKLAHRDVAIVNTAITFLARVFSLDKLCLIGIKHYLTVDLTKT